MTFTKLCAALIIQLFCGQLSYVTSDGNCLLGGFYFSRNKNKIVDYSIQGAGFLNQTVPGPEECFRECSQNCRCISFNYRHPNNCVLNEESRYTAPTLLKREDGSSYYDLDMDYTILQNPSCINNCCKTNPCKNQGNCTELCGTQSKRFQCSCLSGYSGALCEKSLISCEDYYKTGVSKTGTYTIFDEQNQQMTVYCDFSSESNFMWTLIQSFSLANKTQFANEVLYSVDKPHHEENPNWASYRLSQSHLRFIRNHTTHWRATCNFPTDGVDFRDYVRSSFDNFDLMSAASKSDRGFCQKYEFLNIRGSQCSGCTAITWYGKPNPVLNGFTIGIFSDSPKCQFDARNGSVSSEDNFGYYKYTNPNFRCTASPSSTTQFWFGIPL